MRVALVHDYLNQRGGAERVFAHFVRAWPDAPVYTALYDPQAVGDLVPPERVRVSYLNRIPFARRFFRALAPLYPRAFERFDLREFDTIVSSTTAWAKGVIVPPGAVHVCYINTVSRFAFAYDSYVGGFGAGAIARPMVDRLVAWDRQAAQRPTHFVANSRNVAERIRRYYGREAEVLHCPVDVDRFSVGRGDGDYFVIASRLLPYKRIDSPSAPRNCAGVKLLVAGSGPAEGALRELARGTTTTMLGYVDDATLNARWVRRARRSCRVKKISDWCRSRRPRPGVRRSRIAAAARSKRSSTGETGPFFDEPSPESLAARPARFRSRRGSIRNGCARTPRRSDPNASSSG